MNKQKSLDDEIEEARQKLVLASQLALLKKIGDDDLGAEELWSIIKMSLHQMKAR